MCPISAVDSYFEESSGKFILLIADELGFVRLQDITSIIIDLNLKAIDTVTHNTKRNPWRVLAIDKAESGSTDYNDAFSDNSSHNGDFEVEPLLKEF
jgi:hypothetical protein